MPQGPEQGSPGERRGEARTPARGRVLLRSTEHARAICGHLIDRSAHGFRAAHDCPALAAGQTVTVESGAPAGPAQVVWTRIAGGRVESGFRYAAGQPT